MLDTVHVFAGLAIGKHIANPGLAFAVGLLSHAVLDIIPHWDGGTKGKVPEDSQRCGLSPLKKKLLVWDMAVCSALGAALSITGILWPDFPSFSSLLFFLSSHPSLVTGVLGALLWDMLHLWYVYFPTKLVDAITQHALHKKIQAHQTPHPVWSVAFQGLLVALFILLTVSN